MWVGVLARGMEWVWIAMAHATSEIQFPMPLLYGGHHVLCAEVDILLPQGEVFQQFVKPLPVEDLSCQLSHPWLIRQNPLLVKAPKSGITIKGMMHTLDFGRQFCTTHTRLEVDIHVHKDEKWCIGYCFACLPCTNNLVEFITCKNAVAEILIFINHFGCNMW